jgi:hypothetical protein
MMLTSTYYRYLLLTKLTNISLGGKRPGREADNSPPSSAEVKNAWSYTSTPQYDFVAWCSVKAQGQLYFFLINSGDISLHTCFSLCFIRYEIYIHIFQIQVMSQLHVISFYVMIFCITLFPDLCNIEVFVGQFRQKKTCLTLTMLNPTPNLIQIH